MYRIIPDEAVFEQVAALPAEALTAYADLLEVLTLTPWNGEPQHEDNPDAAVRRWHFGPNHSGQIVTSSMSAKQRAICSSSSGSPELTRVARLVGQDLQTCRPRMHLLV
ncbi:MAG TPA: hypothetical protein VE155_13810 [Pseudonocardiaceae bacterium]|nr:hypothetical protein [Pseudonocardiaceae bacterium]